jgi:hypothetical protein
MTKTLVQKYSEFVNIVLQFESEFIVKRNRFNIDEKVCTKINNLIENLLSVKKHDLKQIKKVMKQYFILNRNRYYAREDYRSYDPDDFGFNEDTDISLENEMKYTEELYQQYLQKNKDFFNTFYFCQIIVEYYSTTQFPFEISTHKIKIENYKYVLPTKYFLIIVNCIFQFFNFIDIFNIEEMNEIDESFEFIFTKINKVNDTLFNYTNEIKECDVIIDDIVHHILLDYVF